MTPAKVAFHNTKRAIQHLGKRGYTAANVEKWNHFAKVKNDLFGFADIIGFSAHDVILVQTTSKSNMSARKKKIAANPIAEKWLKAGHNIEIQGWYKVSRYWQVKIETITRTDLYWGN